MNRTLGSNYEADDDALRAARRRRFPITNADRSIGAHLSGEMLRQGLTPGVDGPAKYEFTGSAGQTFGGFLVDGLSFRLLGEANDYVGKSLSGAPSPLPPEKTPRSVATFLPATLCSTAPPAESCTWRDESENASRCATAALSRWSKA